MDVSIRIDALVTFFAATLSAGFDVKAAYLVQGMVMLVVIGGVAWVWMSKTNLALRGSVLTLSLLMFTPYAFIHELALMALPLGWLWEDGRVRGRLPGELMLLLFGWLMPFTVSLIWDSVNILHGKLQNSSCTAKCKKPALVPPAMNVA